MVTVAGGLVSALTELLRRRRAAADHGHARRTNTALAVAAHEQRRLAQQYLDAGRPDLAQPYLDEAALFDAAMSRPPGM
jgi:hypothetical protein